jgi:hypothetical protein
VARMAGQFDVEQRDEGEANESHDRVHPRISRRLGACSLFGKGRSPLPRARLAVVMSWIDLSLGRVVKKRRRWTALGQTAPCGSVGTLSRSAPS